MDDTLGPAVQRSGDRALRHQRNSIIFEMNVESYRRRAALERKAAGPSATIKPQP